MVEGGFLPIDRGWIADVTKSTAGREYITLSTGCTQLAALAHNNLRYNKFIERLQRARIDACEQKLVELAEARGEAILTCSKWNKWALVRGGKAKFAALPECPDEVDVSVEMLDEGGNTVNVTVSTMFNANATSAPKVELLPDTMTMMVRTLNLDPGDDDALGRYRKRGKHEIIVGAP